jgi:hypothetical protein
VNIVDRRIVLVTVTVVAMTALSGSSPPVIESSDDALSSDVVRVTELEVAQLTSASQSYYEPPRIMQDIPLNRLIPQSGRVSWITQDESEAAKRSTVFPAFMPDGSTFIGLQSTNANSSELYYQLENGILRIAYPSDVDLRVAKGSISPLVVGSLHGFVVTGDWGTEMGTSTSVITRVQTWNEDLARQLFVNKGNHVISIYLSPAEALDQDTLNRIVASLRVDGAG